MKAFIASLVHFLVFLSLSFPSIAQEYGGTPQEFIPPQKALQNIVRKNLCILEREGTYPIALVDSIGCWTVMVRLRKWKENRSLQLTAFLTFHFLHISMLFLKLTCCLLGNMGQALIVRRWTANVSSNTGNVVPELTRFLECSSVENSIPSGSSHPYLTITFILNHYRLPVPGLWYDVLQKIRSAGYTGVSFYVDWALLEGQAGNFTAKGVFALEPFFEAASKAGIYLLAVSRSTDSFRL
jgi:hypothetical protein